MVDSTIVKALQVLYQKLRGRDFPWVIMGSLGQAVQGVEIDPKDIDILTDQAGLIVLSEELKEFEIMPPEFEEVQKFRSFHGIYMIEGVKVDILAEFQYKINITGRWSDKLNPNYFITVPFEGMDLQVFRLKTEQQYYMALGDLDRMKRIKEKVDSTVKGVGESTRYIAAK